MNHELIKLNTPNNLNLSLSVVLVRPLYGRNVGATSRALVNMGFDDLILIDPQCSLDYEAAQGAATGQKPLKNVKIFPHWESFNLHHNKGIRLAFTTKDGQNRIVLPFFNVLPDILSSEAFKKLNQKMYFIFGPEDWGLSNYDLSYYHRFVVLPTFGDNPSLNLSQAVLIALYSLRMLIGGVKTPIQQRTYENDFVENQEWFPDQSLKKFLLAMGLQLEGRRVNAFTVLRQYFLRALPTRREKRMLQMIFEQAARKIKNK